MVFFSVLGFLIVNAFSPRDMMRVYAPGALKKCQSLTIDMAFPINIQYHLFYDYPFLIEFRFIKQINAFDNKLGIQ